MTGRLGYIYHLSKENGPIKFSTGELPILVGVKYFFGDYEGPYLAAETGLLNFTVKVKGELMGISSEDSHSELRIPLTLGGGYEFDNIDLRAQLFVPNLLLTDSGEKTFLGVMLNVGYRFISF